MSAVEAIYWGQLPADVFPSWVEPSGVLVALWPSPVDADACFAQAGFTLFRDSDEQWHREWCQAVQRLLDALGSYGPAKLQNGNDVSRIRGRGWKDWLMPWRTPTVLVGLSVAERVALSTQDDWFDDAVVHFGEPLVATLRAGRGHPIVWVAGARRATISGEDLARGMAEERPVIRHQLQWGCLV